MKDFDHDHGKLYLCPHSKRCDGLFLSGKPCGHNLPHIHLGHECEAPRCNAREGTTCRPIYVYFSST
jgi:hypothetical protein